MIWSAAGFWIGKDRDEATLDRSFAWLGTQRARTIQVVRCDMRRPCLAALRRHVPRATAVFNRFHLMQHLTRVVDGVRRAMWRQMRGWEKVELKRPRFLRLKNPENLRPQEQTRLSALLRLHSPIVKLHLLKETLRCF